MDDPWGSPWTAADHAPPKIDFPAPPPSAHFSASAEHSPQRVSPARTPWDDDDAWGGWNETARDKDSPRWGRSPGLRPQDAGGSGSGPASRLPSPSPDAWGQLAMLETARMRKDEKNGDSAISLVEGVRREVSRDRYLAPKSIFNDPKESVEDMAPKPRPKASIESFNAPATEEEPRPSSPDLPPGPAIRIDTQAKTSRQPSLKVQSLVEMYDGIAKRSHSASPIDPSLRKTPSTASLVEGLVVEPTEREPESLDLGPVVDPPKAFEQELDVKETLPSVPVDDLPPFKEPLVTEDRLHVEDTAPVDVPLAVEEPEELLPVVELAQPKSALEVATSSQELKSEREHKEAQSELGLPETTLDEMPQRPTHTRLKPPSTPYAIDMTKLDDLFSFVDTSFPPPEPVPDVIIDDTFASIEERKTWYRISRPGSLRKHNLGDDENYVRINWGTSTLRGEGIVIVRRWMEEDSIAGRVVLGRRMGSATSGKIFNWDSSAPPAEFSISELFSRKSHSRHTSTNSKATIASPTTPAFGWSNGPVAPLTVAIPAPESHVSPNTEQSPTVKTSPSPVVPVIQPIAKPNSTIQPIPSPTSALAQPPTTAKSAGSSQTGDGKSSDEDDEDDDWGEMVSSPTADSNGGFPSLAAIAETRSETNGVNLSRPSSIVRPSGEFIGSRLKQTMSAADWTDVPRSSFDAPPSQGLIPHSQSKSSTTSWTDTNRFSIDIPASQGFLPASHSKSSRTSWTGLARSSLDGAPSEEFIPNKVRPPPLKDQSRPSSWAFGNVDFRDGAPNPVRPIKDLPLSTRKALTLLSKPSDAPELEFPAEHASPVTTSRGSPQPQTPSIDNSEDDETVANILRDLPDLSYMLR